MFLNDCITDSGYFAIGEKKSISVEANLRVDFAKLDQFVEHEGDWKFGFLSYDLKNEFEKLSSNNKDELNFPKLYFFVPKTLLTYEKGVFKLVYGEKKYIAEAKTFLEAKTFPEWNNVVLNSTLSKDKYLSKIDKLQEEIRKGNSYEINFCYEFFAQEAIINPFKLYNRLLQNAKAPFSSFGKFNDKYVISASPERFLKKEGNKLISQPIKGTAKRGRTKKDDLELKKDLESNEKERAENVMIVDLVRNDFSRIAQFDSVNVEELCKVYSFKTVHQMISTVSCQLKDAIRFSDILKATFPMGSMTGAPKVSSMQIIEREEETKRGLYSGSIGYVSPNGDFDFNVVIRTFLYNSTKKYLSAMVGGAITAKSSPESEYEETLIKISALLKSLKK